MINQSKYEFDDLLGLAREVDDPWLNKKLNGHLCYGKGGSRAPSVQKSEVTQTNLPEYLEPYMINLANRAEAESNRKYVAYDQPRIGGLSDDTLMANQAVRDMAALGMPGVDAASNVTANNISYIQDIMDGPGTQPFQFAGAGDFQEFNFRGPQEFSRFDFQDTQKFTDEGVMDDYMSPYMQAVVERQKKGLIDDFNEQSLKREGDLAKQTGGLESSRAFLVNQAAESDLLDRLSDVEATGQEKAFEMAMNQFSQDRSVQMEQESKRFNELASREKAQAAEYARAGDQAAAEAARVQAAKYEDQARIQAAQAAENRAAEQFGLDAAAAAGTQAAQLAKLNEMARAGNVQAIEALGTVGKQLDLREQAQLDLAYEDFLRQQGYGRDQLNFLSGILRGMPAQMGLTEQRMLQNNPLQQAMGAGLGAVSLMRALG
tara:strand:+ start:4223 stop:5518 length:1296 start_codon:yes stop_codon:yes gene_type:complete